MASAPSTAPSSPIISSQTRWFWNWASAGRSPATIFKRHAACRYTHGALDALSEIVGQEGGTIDPVAIEAIEVDTYVWAAQLDSAEPKNMLAAKFSLPFALATFIVNGSASVPAFRGRLRPMRDPRPRTARRGARGCRPDIDAAGPASGAGARPPHDGRVLTAEVLTNKGDTEDPYSADDVQDKFRELAEPVWGPSARGADHREVQRLTGLRHPRPDGLLAHSPKRVGHNEFQDTAAADPGRRCAGRLRSADRIPGSSGGFEALYLSGAAIAYTRPGGRISGSSP